MGKRFWWFVTAIAIGASCGRGPSPWVGSLDLPIEDSGGGASLPEVGDPDGGQGPRPVDEGWDGLGEVVSSEGLSPASEAVDQAESSEDDPGNLPCPWDCDDGLPCTKDWCDGRTGTCRNEEIPGCVACRDGRDCLDGDGCTRDLCEGGRCRWDPIPIVGCVSCVLTGTCDDGNPCTEDRCVGEGYCVFECHCLARCLTDEDCRSAVDRCSRPQCITLRGLPGACSETVCAPGPSLSCDDGNPCTVDFCDPPTGECRHEAVTGCVACHPGDPCDDGDPCTDDRCDSSQGVCVHPRASCDDGKVCTRDWCESGQGCRHDPLPGYCQADTDCRDGEPCTVDRCDSRVGCCRFDPIPGCRVCRQDADCEDHDPCTEGRCDLSTGTCRMVWTAASCEDGEVCTVGDRCRLGICEPGAWDDCDDEDPCTEDVCVAGVGCRHEPNAAPCEDGNPCTAGDRCSEGICAPGTPVSCDDGNPCTSDSCDPAWGCVFDPVDGPCSDGNACTQGDYCAGGVCVPGDPIVCHDGNPCTDDRCDPARGCRFVANALPCDDGDACTEGDRCLRGSCQPGAPRSCDDQVLCTLDGCDPRTGCWHRLDLWSCNCAGNDANCLLTGERTCCRRVDPSGTGGTWRCRIGNDCL